MNQSNLNLNMKYQTFDQKSMTTKPRANHFNVFFCFKKQKQKKHANFCTNEFWTILKNIKIIFLK